jgi:hypothetical protein
MRFTNGAGPVTNPMRIPDENTWNTHHHPHQTNALLQHIDNKMGVTLEKLSNRNTRPSTSILNKLGRRGVLYCSQARAQTTVSNTEPWLCPHTHSNPTPARSSTDHPPESTSCCLAFGRFHTASCDAPGTWKHPLDCSRLGSCTTPAHGNVCVCE